MASAGSIAVRGFCLDIGSTPLGKQNEYHRLVSDCGWDTTKIVGSIAEYRKIEKEGRALFKAGYFESKDLREAKDKMRKWIDNECKKVRKRDTKKFYAVYERVKRNNPSDYSFHAAPWFLCDDLNWTDIMKINLGYDSLLQEYFLAFTDTATSMLSLDEIQACVSPDLPKIFPHQYVHHVDRAVYAGVDPSSGKVNETAWMFLLEPIWDENKILLKPWETLYWETTWEKRHEYTPRLSEHIRMFRPSRVFIDTTGYGEAVVEDLINIYGHSPGIIQGVNLSGRGVYEPIVYNAIATVQSQLVMLPDDERLFDQLFSIEKSNTPSGKAHFTGKINSSDGQDDLFWAYALAVSVGSKATRGQYKMENIDIGKISYKEDKDYNRGKERRFF